MSLGMQMRMVEAMQLNMTAYHKFFYDNMPSSLSSNRKQPQESADSECPLILQTSDQPLQNIGQIDNGNSFLEGHKISMISSLQHEEDWSQTPKIFESHVVNKEEVNLSGVFQSIKIDNQEMGHYPLFNIQLQFQGLSSLIPLTKSNQYSLSNFNSFSNTQQSTIDFQDLLQKVQEKVGKNLTKEGINHILQHLQHFRQLICQNYTSDQSTRRHTHASCLSETNFTALDQQHTFDHALNKHAFNRNKTHKNSAFHHKNSTFHDKNQIVLLEPEQVACPQKRTQEKENRCLQKVKSIYNGFQRQLKVLKKGKELTLSNLDCKHIEQFCITNKIFGKDRDKILRAVNSPKPHLSVFLE